MNELKQKIYKLLPDLKKLEFGCELLTPSKRIVTFVGIRENDGNIGYNFERDKIVKRPATKQTAICITKEGGLYY